MSARGKFVSTLNAWEWPESLDGFTEGERMEIIRAVLKVASTFVPQEEWMKDWREAHPATEAR